MTYELARELRDAGFPQPEGMSVGYVCNTSEKHVGKKYAFCEDCVYIPSLSRLIAACKEFNHDYEVVITVTREDRCFAEVKKFGFLQALQEGKTIKEALVKLYIAIKESLTKS